MAPTSKPCSLYDGRNYDLGDSVAHQLFSVMLQMRREVDRRMVQHDLTDAQWKPLWMLKLGRAGNAIELAREMGIDAGAVTRMLDRLETKGLIERVRSEADRRVVRLVRRHRAKPSPRKCRLCWPPSTTISARLQRGRMEAAAPPARPHGRQRRALQTDSEAA